MGAILLEAKNHLPVPSTTRLRSMDNNALVVGSRIDALMARGFCWQVVVGAFSGGIVGGGVGTTILNTDPELSIDVPRGFTMIPIRWSVQAPPSTVSTGDSNNMEILITADRTQVSGAVAADGTVEVPQNMRTDILAGCPCSAVSANVNAVPTNSDRSFDLVRATQIMDYNTAATPDTALWAELDVLYEPKNPPLIVGPGNISVFFGGTVASTGFIQAVFAAFPTSQISQLT